MQTIRKLLVMILSCIVWLWLPPQIQAAKKQHKSSRTISKAWTNKDWRLTPIPTMYTIPLKAISRVDQQQQQQIKSVAPEHKWILLHFLFWPNSCKNEMEKFHYIRMILHTLSISNHLVGLPNPHYFQVSWRIWLLTIPLGSQVGSITNLIQLLLSTLLQEKRFGLDFWTFHDFTRQDQCLADNGKQKPGIDHSLLGNIRLQD